MLEHKGIDYERVDLPPVVSRVLMRAAGFSGNRVPALKIDGRRSRARATSRASSTCCSPIRRCSRPTPSARAAVEEAERWGDEVFQQMPRTISWWALKRHKSDQASFLEERGPMARLGMPSRMRPRPRAPIVRHRDPAERLDRRDRAPHTRGRRAGARQVDGLIAEGVLGGEQPNAADFQIGASVRC